MQSSGGFWFTDLLASQLQRRNFPCVSSIPSIRRPLLTWCQDPFPLVVLCEGCLYLLPVLPYALLALVLMGVRGQPFGRVVQQDRAAATRSRDAVGTSLSPYSSHLSLTRQRVDRLRSRFAPRCCSLARELTWVCNSRSVYARLRILWAQQDRLLPSCCLLRLRYRGLHMVLLG